MNIPRNFPPANEISLRAYHLWETAAGWPKGQALEFWRMAEAADKLTPPTTLAVPAADHAELQPMVGQPFSPDSK